MVYLVGGLKFVGALSGGIFAGGALYINMVEHPSRRGLPVAALREQWKNSFNLAKIRLPAIGLTSAACSLALYFKDEVTNPSLLKLWLVSPICFLLVGGYSACFMFPEIRMLLADDVCEKKGEEWVRGAIDRWTMRHLARTVLDIGTYSTFLYLILFGKD